MDKTTVSHEYELLAQKWSFFPWYVVHINLFCILFCIQCLSISYDQWWHMMTETHSHSRPVFHTHSAIDKMLRISITKLTIVDHHIHGWKENRVLLQMLSLICEMSENFQIIHACATSAAVKTNNMKCIDSKKKKKESCIRNGSATTTFGCILHDTHERDFRKHRQNSDDDDDNDYGDGIKM